MPVARLAVLLPLVAVLVGCSSAAPGSHRADETSATTTADGPASTGPASSDAPSTAACRPTQRLTRTSRQPRVLYALRFALAPGGRGRGSQDATLYTYPALSPGVYVDAPAGTRLDAATREGLLANVPQGSPTLDGIRGLSWDVRNEGATRRRYLAYAGATVYSARWRATTCVPTAPVLRGSLVVIGRLRGGLEHCGERRPVEPLRRVALITACHHDPLTYRQFRDPTG